MKTNNMKYGADENATGQDRFWPGFTVVCNKCQGEDITLENTLGWSPESGGWGAISMKCKCGYEVEICDS